MPAVKTRVGDAWEVVDDKSGFLVGRFGREGQADRALRQYNKKLKADDPKKSWNVAIAIVGPELERYLNLGYEPFGYSGGQVALKRSAK